MSAEEKLDSLGIRVTRFRVPRDKDAVEALRTLRAGDDGAAYDLDHFYGVNGYEDGKSRTPAKAPPKGNLWVGMIDTGIAPHTALSGVSVTSHSSRVW